MMGVGRGFLKDTYTADPRSPVDGVRSMPLVRKASEVFSACPKLIQQDYRIINEQLMNGVLILPGRSLRPTCPPYSMVSYL